MGIDIHQHRARIGSFNNFIVRPFKISSSHFKNQKTEATYKFSFIKIVIMIPIIISFCAALHQSDLHAYNSNSTLPSDHAQASSVDLMTCALLPYIVNTLAASTFSMVTNFQSRYLNGNRKNQGIKISHWNKGGSHLQNKMPKNQKYN